MSEDVKGIINCLLGLSGKMYEENGDVLCSKFVETKDCRIEEERILVELRAKDVSERQSFVNCVKKLQELISSTKKVV